jgi:hypothetical protein
MIYDIKTNSVLTKRIVIILVFILAGTGICTGKSNRFPDIFDLVEKIPLQETSEILISSTQDLAIDGSGNFWIADWSSSSVIKFDKYGKNPQVISKKGKGPGDVLIPQRIHITDNNLVYIADIFRRITVLDLKGKYVSSFIASGGHSITTSINVSSNGQILIGGLKREKTSTPGYITGNLLHTYTLKGSYVKSFYPMSEKASRLNLKSFLGSYTCFDTDDNIIAVQSMEHKISVFDKNGTYLRSFAHSPKYYRVPDRRLTSEIKRDKKKFENYQANLTYIMDILSFDDRVVLLSRNSPGRNGNQFAFFIDIYDIKSGQKLITEIETDMRLFRIKNGLFYFLRVSETKEREIDEEKTVQIYRMK